MRILTALLIGLPVALLLALSGLYLASSLSGDEIPAWIGWSSFAALYGATVSICLIGTASAAQALRRGCRLGLAAAGALPLVAFAVVEIEQHYANERQYGMGGLMFYGMLVVAGVAAMVLAVLFSLGVRLAGKRERRSLQADKIRQEHSGSSAGDQ